MFVIPNNKPMKKIFFFYAFLTASFTSNAQNYFAGTSPDGVEELYIMSVTANRTTNSMTVFDRIKPVEGKLPEFRHKLAKNKDKETETEDFSKVGYIRRKVQISCYAKKYRIMECTYYEIAGKVIEKVEYSEDDTPWSVLPKGSLVETEFKKVCAKAK